MRSLSLPASLTLTIGLLACSESVADRCECRCPPPAPIEPGRYRADARNPKQTLPFPHADGKDFVLVVSDDKQTFRLTYQKDGREVSETWRRKQ